jgi:HEPN domain-containing protein
MPETELIRKWLDRVDYDMDTARAMLQTGRYIYVVFMCQQSVEKCLKAFLIHKGMDVVPIHNLRRLCDLSGLTKEFEYASLRKLDFLSRFYLNARYKEDIQELSRGITEEFCQEFLRFSEGMIKWLCQKMK